MKKRAFINIILLGFLLISSVVVFVSTTADDVVWKNKYFNLKKITDNSVLALAKHYNVNKSVQDAEDIANGILSNSKLGRDALEYITYTWDFDSEPNNVKATISNYKHKSFWYKFLGKDEFIFKSVESKVNMVNEPLTQSDNFLPIAVNGCTQEFNSGDPFSFILKAHDVYSADDNIGWFALSLPSGGQSSFAHFKNVINHMMVPGNTNAFRVGEDQKFYMGEDNEEVTVATVESSSIENDVQQVASSFDVKKYEPNEFTIAVLDCGSTADEPILQKLIKIDLNELACAQCCYVQMGLPFGGFGFELKCGDSIFVQMICWMAEMFDNITDGIFDTPDIWTTGSSNECNKANLFRIDFNVINSDTSAVLEY